MVATDYVNIALQLHLDGIDASGVVKGTLAGVLGLLVAVPMLAAAMVAVKMLYVEDVVGDDISVLDDMDDG